MVKNIKIIYLVIAVLILFTACSNVKENIKKENNKQENIENKYLDKKNDAKVDKKDDISNKDNNQIKDKQKIEEQTNKKEVKQQDKVEEIDYQKVKPNEIGAILVVMYHGIMDNPPYQRKTEDFKKDLQYMYEHGYRPISIRDYVDNNIKVKAGYTPIVLTFDDGLSSAFSLVEKNGELKPAKNTAVAIMEEFATEHPDFGKAATFYINGGDSFKGAGTLKQRLQYLVNNGYDVANHTYTHAYLNSLSADNIQKEIGKVDKLIKDALPSYTVDTFAYPFGERPIKNLRYLIKDGEYKGSKYHYKLAFRVGFSAPYVAPNNKRFQPLNHPRVTASEGYNWDMWFAFNYYNKHPEYKYISDGNPNRISISKKHEADVNKESLGDKELYIYDLKK